MPLSRYLPVLVLIIGFQFPLSAQKSSAASDPKAVATVQAAIAALGGEGTLDQTRTWKFQSRLDGQRKSEDAIEILTSIIPEDAKRVPGQKAPPSWATPRSLFVPALAGAILLKQSKDSTLSLQQATGPASESKSVTVVFSRAVGSAGRNLPIQRWYFDEKTHLPRQIEFLVPARIGQIEGFSGMVALSDYRPVAGVLYPFQIETFLSGQHAHQKIELVSVTPSTDAPSQSDYLSAGGAQ